MPTGSATPDLNQQRSRKALIGVLLLGGLLLSAPFLWQAWTTSHELTGKVPAFAMASQGSDAELLGCLVDRPADGLKLSIMSPGHFADPARGIVVRIEPGQLKAWIETGGALTAGEQAQLTRCAAS